MVSLRSLRPRRASLVPTVVVASPVLWFLFRAAGRNGFDDTHGLAVLALGLGSLLAGYLLATSLEAQLAPATADHLLTRAVFEPSDGALAAFAALLCGLVGYVVVSTVQSLPGPVDVLARVAGVVMALPLVVLYGGLVAVGNVAGSPVPRAVEWGVVALGVAASVVWTAVLSTGLADSVSS